MKKLLKRGIGLLLTLCVLCGLCCTPIGVMAAEGEQFVYTPSMASVTLSGVKLTSSNKTSTMLQKYTSDQGDVVYNENYEYTYPTYSAAFTGTPTITGATDYIANMKTGHPRLYVDDFSVYVERADSDYTSAKFYDTIIKYANTQLEKEPYLFYMNIRDNINDYSGNIEGRIISLAMAYNLEKTKMEMGRTDYNPDYEKYAERAVVEMLNAAEYPHWSQDAYLCTAEISTGFAIAYDWLYEYLHREENAEALQIIMDTIYEMSIVPYAYMYSKKKHWGPNNWCEVCNGSGMVTAIAFYDANDTTGKFSTLCQYVLESAAEALHFGLVQYQDEGFFREGIGYWGYATEYLVHGAAAVDSAIATENYKLPDRFRHMDVKGVAQTAEFPMYMNGVTGVLNFGDCASSMKYSEIMYWYAEKFNKPEYASYLNSFLQLNGKTMSGVNAVYSLLWYVPKNVDFNMLSRLPLDKAHYSENDVNILTMRSSYEVNSSHKENVFVGMQGGNVEASHIGLSLGSFVLDMNGKRFVQTIGSGNYVWPGYFSNTTESSQRYTYYCMRSEGNNTLIVDPSALGEQSKSSFVPLIDDGTSRNVGYGIMDLTSTNAKFEKYHRGIMITDNRRRVVVQDEIKATAQTGKFNDVYWFAHTGDPENGGATVEISDDGKTAILTAGKVSIRAKITGDCGTFEWVKAEPLPTSPNPEIQHARMSKYGMKLRIHVQDVSEAVIRVEFSPVELEGDVEYAPLADWRNQLSDEEFADDAVNYISTNNYDLDWYDPAYTTYYIHDDKDLAGLAYMVNSGIDFADKTVKLVNDINVSSDLQWVPIGTSDKPFKGTFDGSQKNINGIKFCGYKKNSAGLFGVIEGAVLKNVCLNDFDIEAASDAGALVGTAKESTIYNVYADECTVRASYRLGGLAGTQVGGSIKNCGANCMVYSTGMICGGIVGYTTGVVDNCAANLRLCEYTETKTVETKTEIKENEDGLLIQVVTKTTTTVNDSTGEVTVKVSVSDPVAVEEGEIGEQIEVTGPTTAGAYSCTNYGGIAGLSAFGDVKNSYYIYVIKLVPGGMQAFASDSKNYSHSSGKYTDSTLKVSTINVANPSRLNYAVSGTTKLNNALDAWIADQENASDYLTWSAHSPSYGSAAIMKFVPEEVKDVNNDVDLYKLDNLMVASGQISFSVKNRKASLNNGYLVVVQNAPNGASMLKMIPLSIDTHAEETFSVDAMSGASVKVYVIDSFFNMKVKSNVLAQ